MKINASFSKSAISTSASIGIVVILVIAAAVGVYYYTTLPSPSSSSSTTGSSTTSHSTTTSKTTAANEPSFVTDNTLVYETAGNFQWLDPSVSYYQADYGIFQNVFEKLLWYNGDNSTQLIPWLATNYTTSADGKTWTFNLRQGINFADGTPFNATSVWFSFNRLLIVDGTSGSGVHGSQSAWIIQQLLDTSLSSALGGTQTYNQAYVNAVLAENFVQILGPYKVQFNLMNPTGAFPYLLANEWADIMSPTWVVSHDTPGLVSSSGAINYNAYWLEMAGNGTGEYMNLPKSAVMAGTGPYYIYSVDPTTYNVVLKANTNYWGGPPGFQFGTIGKAKIGTVEINYVPNGNTRLLDLKAGKATMVDTSATDLYNVADKNTWLNQGKLTSIVSGAQLYGTYPQYVTQWYEFGSNVTDASGHLVKFQPMADYRFRLAVASSVNITDITINVANRLATPANQLIPPGTAPTGVHQSSISNPGFNLTLAEQMLVSAQKTPLTSFTYYQNGTKIPSGVIDNSFSASNPQTITLVYVAGGTTGQAIVTQMATNLNAISVKDKLGLTFVTAPLPSGQRYTLMSQHELYASPAGWQFDYNWVLDWTVPMYLSSGTYFSWSYWNSAQLDSLVNQAVAADQVNDISSLVSLTQQANNLENSALYYMWFYYPLTFFTVSTWMQGFYYNTAIGDGGFYFPTYSYAAPMH